MSSSQVTCNRFLFLWVNFLLWKKEGGGGSEEEQEKKKNFKSSLKFLLETDGLWISLIHTHTHRWTYRHAFIGLNTRLPVISIVTPKSSCIWNPRWSKFAHYGLGSSSPFMTDTEAGDCLLCGSSEFLASEPGPRRTWAFPRPFWTVGPAQDPRICRSSHLDISTGAQPWASLSMTFWVSVSLQFPIATVLCEVHLISLSPTPGHLSPYRCVGPFWLPSQHH